MTEDREMKSIGSVLKIQKAPEACYSVEHLPTTASVLDHSSSLPSGASLSDWCKDASFASRLTSSLDYNVPFTFAAGSFHPQPA